MCPVGDTFDAGYEAAADAGSGELLVETLDLRYALYDLDGKTKRAIALDALVMAVSLETLEHEEVTVNRSPALRPLVS